MGQYRTVLDHCYKDTLSANFQLGLGLAYWPHDFSLSRNRLLGEPRFYLSFRKLFRRASGYPTFVRSKRA
jgi:hypothetical protein